MSWAQAPTQSRHSVDGGECRDCVGASRSAVGLNGTSFQVCQDHRREARRRVCHHNPCEAWLLRVSRAHPGVPMVRVLYVASPTPLSRSDRAHSDYLHLLRVAPRHRLEKLDADTHESRVRLIWSNPSTVTIVLAHIPTSVALVCYKSPCVRRDTSQCTWDSALRARHQHFTKEDRPLERTRMATRALSGDQPLHEQSTASVQPTLSG